MKPLYLYLLIINAASFLLMLADKHRAQKNRYRIPEAILFGIALAGGSLGCYSGMYTVRHKTRKPLFAIGIPVVLLIHIASVFVLYLQK